MEKANYPVSWMCDQLGVARSSYYDWTSRAESATAARRRELSEHIQTLFNEFRQTHGCRRIAAELNRRGIPASVGLVADLMREAGLVAVQPRAYKRTTIAGDEPAAIPDLIDGDFTATAPGQRLVGDITYLRTGQGWLYLATVIDLYSRMVVGWQITDHMRTSLVVDALKMAIDAGHVTSGAIFHSDRGSQGGFNWSSQHLDDGGVWWRVRGSRGRSVRRVRGGSGQRTGRCGRRCGRRAARNRRVLCSVTSGV